MDDTGDAGRKALLVLLIIIIAGSSFYLGSYLGKKESLQPGSQVQAGASPPSWSLVISPKGDAEDEIIGLIQSANQTIDVEIYIFTNSNLANALIDAKKRGIAVRVILGSVDGGDIIDLITILEANGIEPRDATSLYKTMHSKIMIVDGKIVLIGSHNLSQSAMFSNREVSIIINDPQIASQLGEIFNSDWSRSSLLQ